jgi:hypothetical protein
MKVRFRGLTKKYKVTPEHIINYIKDYMDYFGKYHMEFIRAYPPDYPGNPYTRTNTLFESWKVDPTKKSSTQLQLYIHADAPYADLVVGQDQWFLHAEHGWPNAYEYFNSPEIRREYKQELNEAMKRALREA